MLALLLALAIRDLQTEHYDVHAEGVNAKEVGAMLEALHAHLTKFFGKAPDGKLRVEIYKTREAWEQALRADRQIVPDAGGYYAPYTKKAYLWLQPSDYFTRQLILHEATHQFHFLVATENKSPGSFWYEEGIAEYFGMHNWDGKELRVGVVPAATLEDYPAKALKNFDALKQDLEGMVAGSAKADRPEAWALTHFLLNKHPKEYRAFAALLDRQEKADAAWKKAFGEASLVKEFRAWIASHAQPWRIVWTAWQERGDAIEGKSQTVGLLILKTPRKFSVEIEGEAKAGLVFGFKSPDDFHLFQILPEHRGRVLHRVSGMWETLAAMDLPEAKGRDVLALTRDAASVTLTVNGTSIGTYAVPGDVGLNVESGRALFWVKF